jgi:signal peptidase I
MKKIWRDNLRALITAIIAVLLVRFFCLEPFKIPTSSMEPTLIGDPACGDHILVNKSAYAWRYPGRWEVVIFRYPLNHQRNFLKRLIGLPGEEVAIKNGNIYVNGRIARKPASVQAALLYPIFLGRKESYEKLWRTEGEAWQWTTPGPVLQTNEVAWCIYNQQITNEYAPRRDRLFFKRSRPAYPTGGGYTVGEVVFSCRVTSHTAGAAVLVQIRKGLDRWLLTLATVTGKSTLAWYHGETTSAHRQAALDYVLPAGQSCALRMSNLDEIVEVRVNGQSLTVMECAQSLAEVPGATHESGVQMGGRHGKFFFTEVEIWRDIYYLGRRDIFGSSSSWQIPSGHYFMLGDNPTHSNDSRDWKAFEIVLRSGLHIAGEQEAAPAESSEVYRFTDIYGMPRTIPRTDVRDMVSAVELPFVPREHLIGRAFVVFWPPTRQKLIE